MTRAPRAPSPAFATAALVALGASATFGCVRAPDVTVVSRRTALEVQASGDYPELEDELTDASIHPRPEDIPREDLAAADARDDLGVVASLYAQVATDLDRIDQLLRAGCIGEGSDGLLTPRPETPCTAEPEPGEVARLVGRANVHRRQVWAYLEEQSPDAAPDEVRDQWREVHLERVVCGAPIQESDGGWAPKECPR